MANIEQYISPDGWLRFRVVTDADGDVSLGFDGYPWHTHASILAVLTGLPKVEAVRQFVGNLLDGKLVVAVWSVGDEVRDIWVSEDPQRDAAYPLAGESIELRYWSGGRWSEAEQIAAADRPRE